ncbi:MAG: phosphatase PAP2 family protein [Microscillaceae bacterium]|nr:phosphatase PAP2 family protein [Microscillaceae bacterium]
MFQTDSLHFLQSFASAPLTFLMRLFSWAGHREFIVLVFVILLFGVNFRRGLLLMALVFWTALLTDYAKDYVAYPRPFHVDNQLALLDNRMPAAESARIFKGGDAPTFWSALPEEVVQHFRQSKEMIAYGFPSGHTSMAVALWGGLMLLFWHRWLAPVYALMLFFVPFSRLYLGVHFLGDLLGGYLLGGALLGLAYGLVFRPARLHRFEQTGQFAFRDWPYFYAFWGLGLAVLPFIFQWEDAALPGTLFGLHLAVLWFALWGMPALAATWGPRVLCMGLAVLLFVGITRGTGPLFGNHGWEKFIESALLNVVFLAGTMLLASLLGLLRASGVPEKVGTRPLNSEGKNL